MWRVKSLDVILAAAEKKSLTRSLGAVQLTLLGIGGVIGTGIFVLTAEAAQKAGPAMMMSFIIAGVVCAVAALCYAELASMAPVAGSAYTYSYAVFGEPVAWLVGWALILEYAVAAGAVSVGWSGYIVGLLEHGAGIIIPAQFANGPYAGGLINLPAVVISLAVTALLVMGTTESATVNAVLVAIKLVALIGFVALSIPVIDDANFQPFAPLGSSGMVAAAASIFFAYVGFDAVTTAAEETKNPQRNVPIGLIASLLICTALYMLVAAGAIGAYGSQPVFGSNGEALEPGSAALNDRCAAIGAAASQPLVCSREALAHVLRELNHPIMGNLMGLAAGLALPSVILMMIYGQTRIFFVMARDGLLPRVLTKIHPRFKTPHVVTIVTGAGVMIAGAFFPVGQLAAVANSGTLFGFLAAAGAVMVLRRTDPARPRPFKTPLIWIVGPAACLGCTALFFFLPTGAKLMFPIWSAVGLAVYLAYGVHKSHLGRGAVEVGEVDPAAPAPISKLGRSGDDTSA